MALGLTRHNAVSANRHAGALAKNADVCDATASADSLYTTQSPRDDTSSFASALKDDTASSPTRETPIDGPDDSSVADASPNIADACADDSCAILTRATENPLFCDALITLPAR